VADILRGGKGIRGRCVCIKRVDEVHVLLRPEPGKERVIVVCYLNGVPSHVRDLEPGGPDKPADGSRDEPESLVNPVLLARLHEHLHAKADAKQGNGTGGADDRFPERAELLHAFTKCPDTGEDETVCRSDLPGIAGDLRLRTCLLKPSDNTPQVPKPIINNGYLRHRILLHGAASARPLSMIREALLLPAIA